VVSRFLSGCPWRQAAPLLAWVALSLSLLSLGAAGASAATSAPVAPSRPSLSGNGALNELTNTEEPTAGQTNTQPAESSKTASNSRVLLVLGGGGAIALLGGIAFLIVRDARRVAPAGDVQLAEARSRGDSAARVRRRRAKAKAARQQRKRNR
jgi:hypothetical protein